MPETEHVSLHIRPKAWSILQAFGNDPLYLLSLSGNTIHRALVLACRAVSALVGVDHISVFLLTDRVIGTDLCAGTTRDTFIGIDFPRHTFLLDSVDVSRSSIQPRY
jgi:hypothetical protein